MSLLAGHEMCISYGGIPAIQDVTLEVNPGEIVALLGPNGAGKTTTVLGLAGELKLDRGTTTWRDEVTTAPLYKRARNGLAFVADDRSIFSGMTARDNLRVGRCDLARVAELAPELTDHMNRRAGLLSGGQQQILTFARAFARNPVVLMADELSLGLAPLVVDRLLARLRAAADEGLGVLLIEQHVRKALKVADRVYVLRNGRVDYAASGADAIKEVAAIEASYLDRAPA